MDRVIWLSLVDWMMKQPERMPSREQRSAYAEAIVALRSVSDEGTPKAVD